MAQSASAYWSERRARETARAEARAHQPFTVAVFADNRCPICRGPLTVSGGDCIAPVTGPGACPRAYTD